MPRRKYAKVGYELIRKDLPLEQLGMAVLLRWHMVEFYFLEFDHDPHQPLNIEKLERIPVNSRAVFAITRRRKIDSARNQLDNLAKRLGFSTEYDGDTTYVIWPNWWKSEGLKPRIENESPPNNERKSGERNGTERTMIKNGAERDGNGEQNREPDHRPPRSLKVGVDVPVSCRLAQKDLAQVQAWIFKNDPSLCPNEAAFQELYQEWIKVCVEDSFTPGNAAAAFTHWLKGGRLRIG